MDNSRGLVDNSLGVGVIHNLSTRSVFVIHRGNQQIVNTVNCGFVGFVTKVIKLQSRNFTNVN